MSFPETPEVLHSWDFPNTTWVPNGYDSSQIPTAPTENFNKLMEEHNKLVEYIRWKFSEDE